MRGVKSDKKGNRQETIQESMNDGMMEMRKLY